MVAEFIAHVDKHLAEHYSDESKNLQQVAFAAVFQNNSDGGRLLGNASIFTVKIHAVKAALTKILDTNGENGSYIIFSGSQSTLLALKTRAEVSMIAEETRTTICISEAENV